MFVAVQQVVDLKQLLLLMLVLVSQVKLSRWRQQIVVMLHVQLCQRVHIESALRQVLHLKILISFHIGAVGRFRSRVWRALGKIGGWVCDLIGRLARRRLSCCCGRLHNCRIIVNERLELLEVQSLIIDVVKVGSTCLNDKKVCSAETVTTFRNFLPTEMNHRRVIFTKLIVLECCLRARMLSRV